MKPLISRFKEHFKTREEAQERISEVFQSKIDRIETRLSEFKKIHPLLKEAQADFNKKVPNHLS